MEKPVFHAKLPRDEKSVTEQMTEENVAVTVVIIEQGDGDGGVDDSVCKICCMRILPGR